MTPRTQTFNAALYIADRLRNFRRIGCSGWTNTIDMDHVRAQHDLMVVAQHQHHRIL